MVSSTMSSHATHLAARSPASSSVRLTPGDDNNDHDNGALLDSFDSYIVVSVLTATSCFAALYEDNPPDRMPLINNLAIFVCAICSLSGIYATVVFSFSSIYGRSALANGRLDVYQSFLKQTGNLRRKAFHMYLLSMVLFVVLLIIAAADKIDSILRIPFVGLMVVFSSMCYRDWSHIISAAGPIFAPRKKVAPPPLLKTEDFPLLETENSKEE